MEMIPGIVFDRILVNTRRGETAYGAEAEILR